MNLQERILKQKGKTLLNTIYTGYGFHVKDPSRMAILIPNLEAKRIEKEEHTIDISDVDFTIN